MAFVRPPRLEGVTAKRARAQSHADAVEHAIRAFLDTEPYPVVVEPHAEDGRYLFKLHDPQPLPWVEFALGIGDCIHNLRSALDFIAWELAGADPSDRKTMFPIFDDCNKFRDNGARHIQSVSGVPRTLIEGEQPYHAPHPQETLLWAIEHLDAADKHRLLTVTVPVTRSLSGSHHRTGPIYRKIDFSMTFPDPALRFEHDAVVAVYTITPPTLDVEVEAEFTPQIAFGDIPGPMYVIHFVRELIGEVDRLIGRPVVAHHCPHPPHHRLRGAG